MSAREVENTVTSPLRRELMQVSGLSEIKSETRDGTGVIHLTMDYGVDTDLAFIEVNEKIDAAMNSLPRDVERPQAVKSSASDIPVTYLQLTTDGDEVSFFDVADNILRRRLEQLPEVSMVDITGVPGKELRITPNYDKMRSAGITINEIENALNENNAEPGSMTVRDGYYEYNIHISNRLRTPEDVKHVPLMKNGRMHTLGDFCEVRLVESKAQGYSLFNGKRAVTMAVIKHEKAGMGDLDKAIDGTVNYFAGQYPDIKIVKTRNQTELLDFTISNLCQNLVLGLILVFLVCALFMRSVRLPLVVGFTVIVAVIVTFLLFYLFRISIKYHAISGERTLLVRQLRERHNRDDHSNAELIADNSRCLCSVGFHERHSGSNICRSGIFHHRRSGIVLYSRNHSSSGALLCSCIEKRNDREIE